MNRRLVRLYNDYKEVTTLFSNHPGIVISRTKGDPPEHYVIEYKIPGIEQTGTEITTKETHLCEIVLPSDYPRSMPICRMLTPVFHPNISPGKICIADHWAAGESLVGIITRIGEMICYQNYNIKSPLNGEAAKWAEANIFRFPLDNTDLNPQVKTEDNQTPENEMSEIQSLLERIKNKNDLVEKLCANCGAKGSLATITECSNGHWVCTDCIVECNDCGKKLCVLCTLLKCAECGKVLCEDHYEDHRKQHVNPPEINDEKIKISYEELDRESRGNIISAGSGMVCQKCGFMAKDQNARFCEKCGNKLAVQ